MHFLSGIIAKWPWAGTVTGFQNLPEKVQLKLLLSYRVSFWRSAACRLLPSIWLLPSSHQQKTTLLGVTTVAPSTKSTYFRMTFSSTLSSYLRAQKHLFTRIYAFPQSAQRSQLLGSCCWGKENACKLFSISLSSAYHNRQLQCDAVFWSDTVQTAARVNKCHEYCMHLSFLAFSLLAPKSWQVPFSKSAILLWTQSDKNSFLKLVKQKKNFPGE